MIFITDALGDVKEAQLAEIPTVAVTWGVHDESFFDSEKYPNIIEVIHNVQELNEFIQKSS
jgi:phosphoglycolate phosphatase-like HAD superfamily hydrolase